MKIDILIPFMDLRRFNSVKSLVVNKKPRWPGPSGGFMRCTGSIVSKKNGLAYNGIKLCGAKIPGLIKLERKLEFPYCNNIYGIYVISFRLKKHSFSDVKSEDLLSFFQNDIQFKVINLTNKYRSNKIRISNLKDLWKELQLQYYWASRKLVGKDKQGRDVALYDVVDGDIIIKQIEEEIRQIKFINSYFFFDSSNYIHKIPRDYHILSEIKVSKSFQRGVSVFHVKRKWFSSFSDLRNHSSVLYAFERFNLFFEMLYFTVEELEELNEIDDSLLDGFTQNVRLYLKGIKESGEYRYFIMFYNFLIAQQSETFSNLISKVNSSTKFSNSQKLALKEQIENMKPETPMIY